MYAIGTIVSANGQPSRSFGPTNSAVPTRRAIAISGSASRCRAQRSVAEPVFESFCPITAPEPI
jgi:hypothetical protein